ncbi:MAG: family 78 glycoside hydrolase catalytic domain [Victivallales bacterium]|nr:family 78 glycoside hydrolase catalytic domain [Victivallales bacterium]
MPTTRTWAGRWINGETVFKLMTEVAPAPYLRKTFVLDEVPSKAIAYVCTPGWHEFYVNGQKADDRVLSPCVSQFDVHDSYIEYDITSLLRPGKNAIVALLGNGLYNPITKTHWNFPNAPWRDYPKLLCDVVADGKLVAKSDASWKTIPSPIRFDQMRNGEHYDFTYEIPGFADPDFDDSNWKAPNLCFPPGGILIREDMEPCRVCERIKPVSIKQIFFHRWIIDFGKNLTGWVEIKLRTTEKTTKKVWARIQYVERVKWGDLPDGEHIGSYVDGEFQTDHIYLRPEPGLTTWHPHFTYHGFRYACVTIDDYSVAIDQPTTTIESIEACFIHNDFARVGTFESSSEMLNKLQAATVQSYLSNFTGIPTDCPHREKNGWTGDARLAAETGLWNYDASLAYRNFIQILVDTQRPSGELPGIAPSAGWGYNWGNGPAFDGVLFELAWQNRAFRGDMAIIREHHAAMKLYLQFCESMANDDLVGFGLGDWTPVFPSHVPDIRLTSTAIAYECAKRFEVFSTLLGMLDDAAYAKRLADSFKNAIQRTFDNHDGSWANDSWTALACILHYHLCNEDQAQPLADRLVLKIRENGHKVDFGNIGSKIVPRAISEYGYADDAFELITQPEFPGWGNWIVRGATSLWEDWRGTESLQHIMHGDISAWMYEYVAGLKPNFFHPGFKQFTIKPEFIKKLNHATATYESPFGHIASSWKRNGNKIDCTFEIPEGSTADIILPNQTIKNASGKIEVTV